MTQVSENMNEREITIRYDRGFTRDTIERGHIHIVAQNLKEDSLVFKYCEMQINKYFTYHYMWGVSQPVMKLPNIQGCDSLIIIRKKRDEFISIPLDVNFSHLYLFWDVDSVRVQLSNSSPKFE